MTTFRYSSLFLFLLLLVSCSGNQDHANLNRGGGTDLGNGSDWIPASERSHWFPREKNPLVEYCIEVSPTFGKTTDEVAELVNQAFLEWESYLRKKNLPLSYLSIAASYIGSCHKPVPLRFYFGVEGEGVAEVISGYRTPFGIAKFTPKTKRGFIWIAESSRYGDKLPTWSEAGFLLTEIMHEIGHVYGNEHVAGTVMREHLAYELPTLPKKYLGRIDHSTELVPHDGYIWNCEPTPIGTFAAQMFSERFTDGALVNLYRLPEHKTIPLPLGAGSVTVPPFPSTLFLNVEANGVSESFVSVGEEAVVSHLEPRRSFLIDQEDFQWSAPVVNRSYVVSLVSEREGKTIRLMLSPRPEGNLEIFLQPDQIPLMTCPLKPTL